MARYDLDTIIEIDPDTNEAIVWWQGEVGGEADTLALGIKVPIPFWNNIYKGVS